MKNKTRILITSMASIAMCASLVAGGTYALFTSESEVNIAVTSGKVDVTANVVENGKTFTYYQNRTEAASWYAGMAAVDADGNVTLDRILPGESVKFQIEVSNNSTIDVQYRTIIGFNGGSELLYDGLTFTIDGEEVDYNDFSKKKIDNWSLISPAEGNKTITVEVGLPDRGSAIDNNYMGLTTNILYRVEAVQGNAKVSNPEAGAYLVSDKAGLEAFAAAVNGGNSFKNKTVLLTSNIDLNNEAWTPIGTTDNRFAGTFDGCGYTVSNLYNVAGNDMVGLFGRIDSATVKNVSVRNVELVGGEYAGAIVGNAYTGLVENCHVSGNIAITANYKVGGIAGGDYAKLIGCSVKGETNSYVKGVWTDGANLEGDNVGGLIGFTGENAPYDRISNCTVENISVEGTRKVGGAIGYLHKNVKADKVTVRNVNVATNASEAYLTANADKIMVGGIVGEYTTGAILSNSSVATATVEGFAAATTGQIVGGTRTSGATIDLTGTDYTNVHVVVPEQTVAVGTAADLQTALGQLSNGETVVLTQDIDLTGETWNVSTPWQGSNTAVMFDGAGHKITGLTTNGLQGGLFGKMSTNGNVTIKNLVLENVTLTGTDADGESAGGALLGWFESHGGILTVENVTANNVTVSGFKYTGGLIGCTNIDYAVNMTNCSVNGGEVTSTYNESDNYKGHIGGLVGYYGKGTVTNCTVSNLTVKRAATAAQLATSSNRAGALIGTATGNVVIASATVTSVTVDDAAASLDNVFGPNASVTTVSKENIYIA